MKEIEIWADNYKQELTIKDINGIKVISYQEFIKLFEEEEE